MQKQRLSGKIAVICLQCQKCTKGRGPHLDLSGKGQGRDKNEPTIFPIVLPLNNRLKPKKKQFWHENRTGAILVTSRPTLVVSFNKFDSDRRVNALKLV